MELDNVRTVFIGEPTPIITVNKKRVITNENRWKKTINTADLESFNQHLILQTSAGAKKTIAVREIKRKLDGYRAQDQKKGWLRTETFADVAFVVDALEQSQYICFYCKQSIKILYETPRDPRQWTLERIANDQGHNKDNVVISCLSCNIRRRTMYHEKYRFTRQIKFEKQVV